MTEEESDKDFRSLYIFGRDVSQIPCFRNSFLYGIGTGAGAGFVTFFRTSRPAFSSHVGFGTFFTVTIFYWFGCRYNYSKKNFELMQLQEALRKHQTFEGTDLANEINNKSANNKV